ASEPPSERHAGPRRPDRRHFDLLGAARLRASDVDEHRRAREQRAAAGEVGREIAAQRRAIDRALAGVVGTRAAIGAAELLRVVPARRGGRGGPPRRAERRDTARTEPERNAFAGPRDPALLGDPLREREPPRRILDERRHRELLLLAILDVDRVLVGAV